MENLSDYGALGAFILFAILVIERILAHFRGKEKAKRDELVASQIDRLYAWHDMRDEDGVPLWYVRKSLETAITTLGENLGRLADAIERMSRSQERIVDGQERIVESLGRVDERVRDLGRARGGAGGM